MTLHHLALGVYITSGILLIHIASTPIELVWAILGCWGLCALYSVMLLEHKHPKEKP